MLLLRFSFSTVNKRISYKNSSNEKGITEREKYLSTEYFLESGEVILDITHHSIPIITDHSIPLISRQSIPVQSWFVLLFRLS